MICLTMIERVLEAISVLLSERYGAEIVIEEDKDDTE